MSDLIDRKMAIDEICRVCLVCCTETCQGRNPDSRWCEEITALREIPSEEPKWIPVTERLPEEDGDYIVAVHYITLGKLTSEIEVAFFDSEIWEFYDYTMSSVWCEVVAWMPLPEPFERAD